MGLPAPFELEPGPSVLPITNSGQGAGRSGASRSDFLFKVSQLNQVWRDVTLSNSQLWTHFYLTNFDDGVRGLHQECELMISSPSPWSFILKLIRLFLIGSRSTGPWHEACWHPASHVPSGFSLLRTPNSSIPAMLGHDQNLPPPMHPFLLHVVIQYYNSRPSLRSSH